MRSEILGFLTSAVIFLALFSFSQPSSGANPNAIVKTEADIDAAEACVDCHDVGDLNLSGTPHEPGLLVHGIQVSCIDCHTGGGVHIEDPSTENIGKPSDMEIGAVIGICTQCHLPHMELDNIGYDPHLTEGLSCLDCHSIHKGQDKLLADDKLEFCSKCHTAVANQFIKTSNHPMLDGAVSCISCHDFTGKTEPMYLHGAGATANCVNCHPNEGGPHLFEHEATSGFSTEGEGCVACHNPHGSSNERLLTRPESILCQQCHGTPARHITQHNGIGTMYSCMECHSTVHGSNVNKTLLDPDLGARVGSGAGSCICHNISG